MTVLADPKNPPAYFSELIEYSRRRGVLITHDRCGRVTVSGPGDRAPHQRVTGEWIDAEARCWVLGEVLARGVWVDPEIVPKSMRKLCREGNMFNDPVEVPVASPLSRAVSAPAVVPAECPHPDKRRYPDRLTADVALTRILSCHARDRNHIPIRVYECRCGGWHLTSQRLRTVG